MKYTPYTRSQVVSKVMKWKFDIGLGLVRCGEVTIEESRLTVVESGPNNV